MKPYRQTPREFARISKQVQRLREDIRKLNEKEDAATESRQRSHALRKKKP